MKERPTSHKTLQEKLTILLEMQTSEAQRHTNNLLQNSKGKNVRLKMHIHRLSLKEGVKNLNLNKELCCNQ
jgi:hypothetical protein